MRVKVIGSNRIFFVFPCVLQKKQKMDQGKEMNQEKDKRDKGAKSTDSSTPAMNAMEAEMKLL